MQGLAVNAPIPAANIIVFSERKVTGVFFLQYPINKQTCT